MESLERMRDKSIPTTIPFPDSQPSYQRTRAALTHYIINRKQKAMEILEGIRDKYIQRQQLLVLIHSHLISGLELHLHTILSTEERWKWKASIELGTKPIPTKSIPTTTPYPNS